VIFMSANSQMPKIPPSDRPSDKFSNPVFLNLYSRRSVRAYKPDPVPDETLLELIKAGTYAPTASNTQPWRFVVVTNREQMDAYAERAKQLWLEDPGIKAAQASGRGGPELERYMKMMSTPGLHIFHHAPALVFIYAEPGAATQIDCCCAAENMMLAAQSLGLGSCWIGLARPLGSDKKTRQELGVPDHLQHAAALVFGYPTNDVRKAPPRKEDVLISWFR